MLLRIQTLHDRPSARLSSSSKLKLVVFNCLLSSYETTRKDEFIFYFESVRPKAQKIMRQNDMKCG